MGHIPLNKKKNYTDNELKLSFKQSVFHVRRELQLELTKIRHLEAKTNLIHDTKSNFKHIIFAEDHEDLCRLKEMMAKRTNEVDFYLSTDNEDIHHQRLLVYKELSQRLDRANALKLELAKREAKSNLIVGFVHL